MSNEGLTDDAIRARAAALVRSRGPNPAARELGVSREAVLSLAAGAPVTRGTIALARERLRQLTGGTPPEAA